MVGPEAAVAKFLIDEKCPFGREGVGVAVAVSGERAGQSSFGEKMAADVSLWMWPTSPLLINQH